MKVSLDKPTLGFLDVGLISVTVERQRGNLTVLEWGNHTITVRWDKGIVEMAYDDSSPVDTTYAPASCGKPSSVIGKHTNSGMTWIWGG